MYVPHATGYARNYSGMRAANMFYQGLRQKVQNAIHHNFGVVKRFLTKKSMWLYFFEIIEKNLGCVFVRALNFLYYRSLCQPQP